MSISSDYWDTLYQTTKNIPTEIGLNTGWQGRNIFYMMMVGTDRNMEITTQHFKLWYPKSCKSSGSIRHFHQQPNTSSDNFPQKEESISYHNAPVQTSENCDPYWVAENHLGQKKGYQIGYTFFLALCGWRFVFPLLCRRKSIFIVEAIQRSILCNTFDVLKTITENISTTFTHIHKHTHVGNRYLQNCTLIYFPSPILALSC